LRLLPGLSISLVLEAPFINNGIAASLVAPAVAAYAYLSLVSNAVPKKGTNCPIALPISFALSPKVCPGVTSP
jgi:hypothetical protein